MADAADVIVVGSGLAGSATAWAAARRGLSVLVFEAFPPGHENGSSHGSARIFRRVYDDPLYVRLTGQAGELWRQLEDESGQPLIHVTGGLDFGAARDLGRLHETLTACGVRADLVPPAEARRRWPGFGFDSPVVYQPDAGALDPDRAMSAMRGLAAGHGARIRFGARVTDIGTAPGGGARVRVAPEDAEFTAPVAVLAAGAWLEPLIGKLVGLPPLIVTQEQVLHLPPRVPPGAAGDPWPAFIYEDTETCFYGLLGGRDGGIPGAVKIGEHHAGTVTTAGSRTFAIDPGGRQRTLDFAARYLPGLDNSKVASETTCLYTTTGNQDFILDRQGPFVIASACSGHGAKFAPLLGEIVVGLVVGEPSPDRRFTLAAHLATGRTAGRTGRIAGPAS
ncbi:MAG TPA: FAD-dependent oxidoreductase [Trebonia sp.]|jgi:sarcosine oxidase|nr:FAD-dependent oxidoreductase [Trebonia sp.]